MPYLTSFFLKQKTNRFQLILENDDVKVKDNKRLCFTYTIIFIIIKFILVVVVIVAINTFTIVRAKCVHTCFLLFTFILVQLTTLVNILENL